MGSNCAHYLLVEKVNHRISDIILMDAKPIPAIVRGTVCTLGLEYTAIHCKSEGSLQHMGLLIWPFTN